jgi:hypothetical protein
MWVPGAVPYLAAALFGFAAWAASTFDRSADA